MEFNSFFNVGEKHIAMSGQKQSLSSAVAVPDPNSAGRQRPARRKRSAPPGDRSSPEFIEALARGLSVLRCFSPGATSLGNLELSELTGLPKSTISRVVYTLTTLGYLRYDAATGRYSPGYGVLALGFGCLASLEVRQLARPFMEELAQASGAAIALGTFDGTSMTYIETVHGSPALYLRLSVGARVGMHSSMGRAYLASLAPAQREQLLAELDVPPDMPAIMHGACRDYSVTGCCYGLGDWQPGINAVATPFTTASGEGPFVLSCGGPERIVPEGRLRGELTEALLGVARQLSPAG